MFIRFDVIHERDGRTDGRTLRDSKDRVCIASRDKMDSHFHCYAGLIELLFKPSYFLYFTMQFRCHFFTNNNYSVYLAQACMHVQLLDTHCSDGRL